MSRFKKPLLVFSITTLFVCGIGGALFFATGIPQAANQLDEQRKRAQDRGLNVTFASYLAERNIPDSENAGVELKEFFKGVQAIKSPIGAKPADLGSMEEYERMVPLLPLFEASKKKPKYNVTAPSTTAVNMLFPELANLKKAVKIFVGRAKIASENGDLSMAKKCLDDALYLSSVADASNTLIGELVQIASASIMMNEIRTSLEQHQSQSNWIQMLKGVTEKIDDRPDLKKCLKSEHMMCTDVMDNLRKNPSFWKEVYASESGDKVVALLAKVPRALDANEARIHERYANLIDELPKDEYDYAKSEKALAKLDTFPNERDLSYTLSRILFPVFTQVSFAMHKRSASRAVLLEAITYLEGKNSALKAPTLTGNRYLDLDGNPIKIKTDVKGEVWFYSVGGNKIDDDGENNAKSVPKKDDFTVKLKRR